MARLFLASTLPERSRVAFFTTIIRAARGSCWGPSLGVSPGPGLPLARSTPRLASSSLATAHRHRDVFCCLLSCCDRVTILWFWQPQVAAQGVGLILGPK